MRVVNEFLSQYCIGKVGGNSPDTPIFYEHNEALDWDWGKKKRKENRKVCVGLEIHGSNFNSCKIQKLENKEKQKITNIPMEKKHQSKMLLICE